MTLDYGVSYSDTDAWADVDGTVHGMPITIEQAHQVFRRWLGDTYDTTVLDAVLSAAASERLGGDPCWLMVIAGSGAAKTETVTPLAGAGAVVTSTISSEGALLSATGRKDRDPKANGGLLRKLGTSGLLVIKDFTSILSMSRDTRGAVLAALREIYDGRWERNVGTDGGRCLTWTGRLVVIGASTTTYDSAHAVIASMGDRFALVRLDSGVNRMAAGRHALANVGQETAMREQLTNCVRQVLDAVEHRQAELDPDTAETLLAAANLVTLCRTADERDYQGEVLSVHAPEAATRFAKMLAQITRGAQALGCNRHHAIAIALRVAHDSIPPLRLRLLTHLTAHPGSSAYDCRKHLGLQSRTVDRELQSLQLLEVLRRDETESRTGGTRWVYRINEATDAGDEGVDITALRLINDQLTGPTPVKQSRNGST